MLLIVLATDVPSYTLCFLICSCRWPTRFRARLRPWFCTRACQCYRCTEGITHADVTEIVTGGLDKNFIPESELFAKEKLREIMELRPRHQTQSSGAMHKVEAPEPLEMRRKGHEVVVGDHGAAFEVLLPS